MSQGNVEMRRVIDARNRGDWDAAFAYAAPDIDRLSARAHSPRARCS
jgi:hypothetical protein